MIATLTRARCLDATRRSRADLSHDSHDGDRIAHRTSQKDHHQDQHPASLRRIVAIHDEPRVAGHSRVGRLLNGVSQPSVSGPHFIESLETSSERPRRLPSPALLARRDANLDPEIETTENGQDPKCVFAQGALIAKRPDNPEE